MVCGRGRKRKAPGARKRGRAWPARAPGGHEKTANRAGCCTLGLPALNCALHNTFSAQFLEQEGEDRSRLFRWAEEAAPCCFANPRRHATGIPVTTWLLPNRVSLQCRKDCPEKRSMPSLFREKAQPALKRSKRARSLNTVGENAARRLQRRSRLLRSFCAGSQRDVLQPQARALQNTALKSRAKDSHCKR